MADADGRLIIVWKPAATRCKMPPSVSEAARQGANPVPPLYLVGVGAMLAGALSWFGCWHRLPDTEADQAL
jgi:hypothetical protein